MSSGALYLGRADELGMGSGVLSKVRSALNRPYTRMAVMSAGAAAVAYAVAGLLPGYVNAAVAGLTALISIRPTFHDTAAESWRQIVGTVLGAAFGLVLTLTMGYSPIAIALMILVCFAVAAVMKLGEEGAAVMGVTVILVVGPFFDTDMVESRFFGVLVGSVIALIASLWVRPGKPHARALSESVTLARSSADMVAKMGEYLGAHDGTVSRKITKSWVLQAEKLMSDLAEVRNDAESALRSSRWSPLVRRQEAEAIVEQVILAQITARTTYNMARDLHAAAKKGQTLPATVATHLAAVLAATADTITEQAGAAVSDPAAGLDWEEQTMSTWSLQHGSAIAKAKDLEETQPLLLAGSLLRDSEKIADALTVSEGEQEN